MDPAGEAPAVARQVLVDGRVQGVGYRQACVAVARRAGVAGWVRNLRDGRVEAHFEGRADAVARVVDWCRSGPPMASVTGIRVTDVASVGAAGFRVATTD